MLPGRHVALRTIEAQRRQAAPSLSLVRNAGFLFALAMRYSPLQMVQRFRALWRHVCACALLAASGCSDSSIPVGPDDPVDGAREALATVVVFGDYQCPYTARAMQTLEVLRARYPADQLRIAWKHFPLSFHADARPLAEAAAVVNVAAGAEPFWRISRRLLESQRAVRQEALDQGVVALGIPLGTYRTLEAQGIGAEKVDADLLLATNLGVRASPTLFVNGIEIEGALPVEDLARTIDGALAQARAQVANGIDRADVYDVVTGLNRSFALTERSR